ILRGKTREPRTVVSEREQDAVASAHGRTFGEGGSGGNRGCTRRRASVAPQSLPPIAISLWAAASRHPCRSSITYVAAASLRRQRYHCGGSDITAAAAISLRRHEIDRDASVYTAAYRLRKLTAPEALQYTTRDGRIAERVLRQGRRTHFSSWAD